MHIKKIVRTEAHLFSIVLILLLAVFFSSIFYIINTSEPASAFFGPFGGIIQSYTPACFIVYGKCTCPACDLCCNGHSEILFMPETGSVFNFICPPTSQIYSGPGIIPMPGAQLLGNGMQCFPTQVGLSLPGGGAGGAIGGAGGGGPGGNGGGPVTPPSLSVTWTPINPIPAQ